MSQLKKQSVAARKSPRRGRASSAGSVSLTFRAAILAIGGKVFQLLVLATRPCFAMAKRWPRATLLLAATLISLVLAGYGVRRLMMSVTQSLPEQIEVRSPRAELYSAIMKISRDTLSTAKSEKWSRTALTDKLLSRVSAVDGVDEVSLRAGLDKTLRIEVSAQAPLLVIEGKSSERILVGSKFKIIARSVGQNDYTHLPVLEASELPLNIHSNKERRKAHNGLFVRPTSVSSANIRWLSQQTLRIHSLFGEMQLNAELEKISWRHGTGFSIVMKSNDSSGTETSSSISPSQLTATPMGVVDTPVSPAPLKTTVVFGEGELTEKFDRLMQVMQDLRLKKTAVEQIDLSFADKAVIRMAEQLSEKKTGGTQ